MKKINISFINRFEKYSLSVLFVSYFYASFVMMAAQADPNILLYSLVICMCACVANIVVSSVIHYIPYIPREVSTVYFGSVLLAVSGIPLALVLVITLFILFSYATIYVDVKNVIILKVVKSLSLLVTLLLVLYGLVFTVSDRFNSHVSNSASFNFAENNIAPYPVSIFSYGSAQDKHRSEFSTDIRIVTKPFDASNILTKWDGFSGWYRSYYWGFNADQLPLNARVWLPEGEGKFPLVLIMHGDHAMQDYSDTGYEYLANYLAEKGYIAVSLDQNFLNRSWSDLMLTFSITGANEIKTRAQLTIEHLKLWKEWNLDRTSFLYQKIDMKNVAVLGHSRGGAAAVAIPSLLSSNAELEKSVKAIIAVAPATEGIYQPQSNDIAKQTTNQLVITGSLDKEVYFDGMGIFENKKMIGGIPQVHSVAYIEGANHGQFNTNWGNCDAEFFSAFCSKLNLRNLISQNLQQDIAKSLIGNFLDLTLLGEESHREELKLGTKLKRYEKFARIKLQYKDHLSINLFEFESENINEFIQTSNLEYAYIQRFHKRGKALKLSWANCPKVNNSCFVAFTLPKERITNATLLSIDIANQLKSDAGLSVEVGFADGSYENIQLNDTKIIQGAYFRTLKKSAYLLGSPQTAEVAFETKIFEIESKMKVQSIKISFDQESHGAIYIDNITVYPST